MRAVAVTKRSLILEEKKASDTALGVAVLRAVHQLTGAEPKILEDPVIVRMLDETTRHRIEAHPEAYLTPERRVLLSNVLVRSRYAEDQLAEAVAHGIRQFVILGAGMDTFAYRQPAWADKLQIFELDHPASQKAKRHRLGAARIPTPANLRYVEIDFEKDTLPTILARGDFDFREPAFFSCLGVLMYLTGGAVDAILQFVASMPRSSEIVFSFANAGLDSTIEKSAEAAGEPWLTKFQPDELDQKLRGLGFSEIRFLTPEMIAERYFHDRRDGLSAPRRASIVNARV